MQNKKLLTDKQASFLLGALCALVYFTSYLSRYSLTVCIAEIEQKGILTNEQLGLATMLLFIFYGVGQLVSGFLGDKFPPQIIVSAGLVGSGLSNLLLPIIVKSPVSVAVLWAVHGLFQAMFWPPLVKIISSSLPLKHYAGTTLAVSIAAHVANISNYVLAFVCIGTFKNWKLPFVVALIMCTVVLAVWNFGFKYFNKNYKKLNDVSEAKSEFTIDEKQNQKADNKKIYAAIVSSGTAILFIAIILQGAIKEGVTAWLPSYILATYGGDSSSAILKSVAIPIASIVCLFGVSALYKRFLKNEALGGALMFAIGAAMAAIIAFFPNLPPLATIICAAILTGSMHGVNLFLIAYIPARFASLGKTSTVSGITNSCAYAGCALYTYGVAHISNRFGWQATTITWFVIPVAGFIACFAALPLWNKFISKK